MSYYVESKVKNDKPDCFGNDDEYIETSSACRGCGFRQECSKQIQEKAKQPVTYYRPRAVSSAYAPSSSATTTTTRPVVSTQRTGIIKASEVDFNFDKPVLKQFGTYLAYDIAQVTTERVHSLILAARENYRKQVVDEE
jgi:hypothetical protein